MLANMQATADWRVPVEIPETTAGRILIPVPLPFLKMRINDKKCDECQFTDIRWTLAHTVFHVYKGNKIDLFLYGLKDD